MARRFFGETRKNPSAKESECLPSDFKLGSALSFRGHLLPSKRHFKACQTAFEQFSLPYTHGRPLFRFSPPLHPPWKAVFQVLHTTS